MTVPVQDTVFSYTGNGVTTVYPFTCLVVDEGDLFVFVDDVELTSGFTISGIGVESGGSVTITPAPESGVSVSIKRIVALERTTDYQQNGDFLAPTVNADFDRIWMALQQFEYFIASNPDAVSRFLRIGDSDVNGSGSYRALQNRIQDLADPVDQQDAANKQWVQTQLASFLADGAGQFVLDLFAATSGASLSGFIQPDTGAVANTVEHALQPHKTIFNFCTEAQITDILDSITGGTVTTLDFTAVLQAALDAQVPVLLYPARYKITDELVWSDGSYLYTHWSAFFFQVLGNEPAPGRVAEICYSGAGGANSCVCRMSKEAVGTKPIYEDDESQTLRGAGISGIFINGNNLAEYGLYAARAGLGNEFHNIVATGCKEHGIWMGEMWNCKIGPLFAIYNYGCGISIGIDTFSWSGGNTVNGVVIDAMIAYGNGRAVSSWTTADYLSGYGVGYAPGRACVANYIDAEWNNGVGVVWAPTSGPQQITCLYEENNCQSADSSNRWGIWYQSNANSLNATLVNSYHLWNGASGNTDAPRIKITGTAPLSVASTNRPYLVLKNITGGLVVDADFGDYRIEQYPMTLTSRFVSHYPQWNDPDTITSSLTTLYVDDTATGTGSGIDSSNKMALGDGSAMLRVYSVVSSLTTIDCSGVTSTPSAALTLDGSNIKRRLTISGGTTGRFNAVSGTAVTFQNFQRELTIDGFAVVERSYYKDGRYVLNNCPVLRMDTGSTAGAAVNADNCNMQISGTSVISVSGSSAATKIGISVAGNSQVVFSNAAAGTITGYSAANAINFDDGGGTIRISLTTATAVWGASAQVTRNSGGGAGIIVAPNGLNP